MKNVEPLLTLNVEGTTQENTHNLYHGLKAEILKPNEVPADKKDTRDHGGKGAKNLKTAPTKGYANRT